MGQNEKTEPKPQFVLGFDWCTICTLAAREAGCSCLSAARALRRSRKPPEGAGASVLFGAQSAL